MSIFTVPVCIESRACVHRKPCLKNCASKAAPNASKAALQSHESQKNEKQDKLKAPTRLSMHRGVREPRGVKTRSGGTSFLGWQRKGGSPDGQAVAVDAVAFEKPNSFKIIKGSAALTFKAGHLHIAASGDLLEKY